MENKTGRGRYKIKIIFTKKGLMRYISHLDLMRLFQRALRRARVPIALTQGFSPHPKMSFKRALKLGIESDAEEATFILKEEVDVQIFKDTLQPQLPEGICIKEVYDNV